jgi:hypothetical protein
LGLYLRGLISNVLLGSPCLEADITREAVYEAEMGLRWTGYLHVNNFMRDKDEYAMQISTDSKYAISAGSILKVQNFLKILIINF